jgi:hypothetical protein
MLNADSFINDVKLRALQRTHTGPSEKSEHFESSIGRQQRERRKGDIDPRSIQGRIRVPYCFVV